MSRKTNGASSQRDRPTSTNAKSTGKLVDGISEADWDRLRNLSDEEIHRRALSDPDAQPTTREFWKNARVVVPTAKEPTSIRLDSDILTWFKESGKGYQTRINAVLRTYVDAQRKGSKAARR
ncbi:MAG: BrnA antitoxin family protein [Alphaproteobacteria bacterium]|nr:BrnA antitoxin family protein [Alphaproteobacteria bacterium]